MKTSRHRGEGGDQLWGLTFADLLMWNLNETEESRLTPKVVLVWIIRKMRLFIY